ncbi:MAG: prepilin, partial [Comamonadaceae bacterium]
MSGIALVELTLVLALMTLLAVWGVQTLVDRARDAAAQAAGTWMVEIRHGVLQMLGSHFDALAKGESPRSASGEVLFDDPLNPGIEALKRAGHLPASFPTRSAMGFSARVMILRDRRCPGEGCRLDALVLTDAPVLDRGRVDSMGIAQMLMATQGWGGQVAARAPGRLVGTAVDMPNPVAPGAPAWPVGTVAAWAGLDRESTRQYLRVGDTRDPAFQGSVTVAGKL